jgi:uncharacterized protein YeeX (DUF496 family)
MPGTTTRPLPVEADVEQFERVLQDVYDALEALEWSLRPLTANGLSDPTEVEIVETEHIAALAAMVSDLESRIDDYQGLHAKLRHHLRVLSAVRQEQQFQIRRRQDAN